MDVTASAPATASDAGRPVAVFSVYLLMVLLWATDAISVGSLFDVYVADVAQSTGYVHPNEFIGFLESVRGLTAFAAAFPLGYLSDRFDRFTVLRSCGFVFGLSGAVALVLLNIKHPPATFCIQYGEAASGSLDAVLADIVPAGPARTAAYARSRTLMTSARALGPFLQAVFLSLFGRELGGSALGRLLAGGYLGLVCFLVLLWPLHSSVSAGAGGGAVPLASSEIGDRQCEKVCGVPKYLLIPGLIAAFNITFMLGGGITLKFYPLFYHREYGLSDVEICWIMAGYWNFTAVGTKLVGLLTRCRRAVAVLSWGHTGSAHFALNTALTMDYALPKHRGRWAAVSSLNRATWAGSAAVGGVLVDQLGFRASFAVTGELVKTSEMNAAQPFDVININLLQPSGKSTALVVKEWDLIMDVMIQIKEAWPADEPQPGDDNMFDNRQVDLVHNGSHLMDTNLVCQRGINEGDTLLVLFSPLPAGPKRERGCIMLVAAPIYSPMLGLARHI
ncbi:hypothetical protein AK812_SmicGene2872 [Symbiodinium microadriaticum]|uniref:Major facilitator superfamily (MFS) profile domain-containing protein n=1 Tax=Symbiodinium microadriaticum TaxID=2951 RepID=A0A1Q9F0F8_SYMMI|nr:hypothetical protein AK812_SmicGene2872 [Symbiodinium microadriaticum]